MSEERVAFLGDAHLGRAPSDSRRRLHQFLAHLPDVVNHLVIVGDLFEFWFEYRTVIPRHAFSTLAALAELRARDVQLTVLGGNHDRWGGRFWEEELGASFYRRRAELDLAGLRTVADHGDGLSDAVPASRLLQAVVHHPLTERVFRWLHPDIGLRVVDRAARRFPGTWAADELRRQSAAAQETFARAFLAERPDVRLLVLGHTHVPVLESLPSGQWYVNPGAWMDGGHYALLTSDGPCLSRWAAP